MTTSFTACARNWTKRDAPSRSDARRAAASFGSYYWCESREDRYAWESNVAEQIIDSAERVNPSASAYLEDRAFCPLCRDGSSSPYVSGFSVPEGLRRHLLGWGNVRQCGVMKAAIGLARANWHARFDAADRAERVEAQARREERRRSETLYRLGPDQEPKLIDDEIWYGSPTRSDSELAWAERRLDELGFKVETDGRTKAYVQEREEFVVFADPRVSDRIVFSVYATPRVTTSARKSRGKARPLGRFWLMDSWKHDLRTKFEACLAKFAPSVPGSQRAT